MYSDRTCNVFIWKYVEVCWWCSWFASFVKNSFLSQLVRKTLSYKVFCNTSKLWSLQGIYYFSTDTSWCIFNTSASTKIYRNVITAYLHTFVIFLCIFCFKIFIKIPKRGILCFLLFKMKNVFKTLRGLKEDNKWIF